jgi:hypothetical protein
MADNTTQNSTKLGDGRTNSTQVGFSNVDVKVSPEPLAVLHTGTGEMFFIPAQESAEFTNHYRSLSDAVAEVQSANAVVQILDEHRAELMCKNGPSCPSLQSTIKALELALDWQDQAHGTYHDLFGDLDQLPQASASDVAEEKPEDPKVTKEKEDNLKLSGTGRRLLEFIALKKLSPEEQEKKKADEKKFKYENGELKKQLASAQSIPDLKELAKWPKAPSDTFIYARSDKIKIHWPKAKNLDKTKWSEVIRDEQGNHRFDAAKMRRYALEQADKKGIDWVKKKLGLDDIEFSRSITLGQWCTEWNKKAVKNASGPWTIQDTKIADWDSSAQAQLMRFSYGASLKPDFSITGKSVSVRAEGHAEADLAKAQAGLKLYFPKKDGWMWSTKGSDGKDYDLVAMVFEADLQVSGVVGASVSCELSLEVNAQQVTEGVPKVRAKPGPKGRDARRKNRAELKKGDDIAVADLEGGVNAFAGVQVDGELAGSLNWRNPHDDAKSFAALASIDGTVGASAGLLGDARFSIEYTHGMFKCNADAGLCIGVGAQGAVGFTVGAKEIESFFLCVTTNIAYGNFHNLNIFVEDAFDMFVKVQAIMAATKKTVDHFFGWFKDRVQTTWNKYYSTNSAEVFRILSAADTAGGYLVPEARGMIVSRVMELSQDPVVLAEIPDAVQQGQSSVIAQLGCVTCRRELDNVIQHAPEVNVATLTAYFKLGNGADNSSTFDVGESNGSPASKFRALAMSGDFPGWYSAMNGVLVDEVPHGYPLVAADSETYALENGRSSHPLYRSGGLGAYYTDQV